MGYSPWGHRVTHNRVTKYITAHSKGECLILKTFSILCYYLFLFEKLIYYKNNIAKIQIKILMKEKVLNSTTDYFFLFSIFSYTFSFQILLFPTYSPNLSSYGKEFDLGKERLM